MAQDAARVIEGRWNPAAFTRSLSAAAKRIGVARRSGTRAADDPTRWRRADLLWPDIASSYED